MNSLFDYRNCIDDYSEVHSNLLYGVPMDIEPLVSILMPTYNHTKYLKEALLSAINQDCDFPYEIIVVDNNHESLHFLNCEIVKDINSNKVYYYLNEKNIGPCANWNRCIQLAKGKYVSFCHDDDCLKHDALSSLINVLHSVDKLDISPLIIGAVDKIDLHGNYLYRASRFNKPINKLGYKFTLLDFLENNVTNGCGSLYSRANLIEIGGYNNNFNPCFDYALNVAYTFKFGAFYSLHSTVNYRITDENDSRNCYSEIPQANEDICRNIISIVGDKLGLLHYILKANREVVISVNNRIYNNMHSFSLKLLWYRFLLKLFHFYNKLNRLLNIK